MTKFEIFIKKLQSFFKFIITPANPKENIFQYIMRYFLLSDSKGNPSWTITILFCTLVLVGCVVYNEMIISTSFVQTFNDSGILISSQMKGFSSEFYYLVILLAGLIVWFFKLRGDNLKKKTDDTVEKADSTINETISTVVENAKNVISSLKK